MAAGEEEWEWEFVATVVFYDGYEKYERDETKGMDQRGDDPVGTAGWMNGWETHWGSQSLSDYPRASVCFASTNPGIDESIYGRREPRTEESPPLLRSSTYRPLSVHEGPPTHNSPIVFGRRETYKDNRASWQTRAWMMDEEEGNPACNIPPMELPKQLGCMFCV